MHQLLSSQVLFFQLFQTQPQDYKVNICANPNVLVTVAGTLGANIWFDVPPTKLSKPVSVRCGKGRMMQNDLVAVRDVGGEQGNGEIRKARDVGVRSCKTVLHRNVRALGW
jgi:hypothetical protein